MEFWTIVLLVTVVVVLLFALALCVAILFARVAGAEELALEKSEPKALELALAKAEGTAARVDNALLELGKFREGIHGEMQRFYAIMRRNEKAIREQETQETPDKDEPPDEISVADLKRPVTPEGQMTRAELRQLARERGSRI
jgi:hypothetical protein